MPLQRADSASERCCEHGKRPGLSGHAHVGVGVREHVERLGWKTRYDESMKLFDESLQNS
jgi:hypothetical protein